MLAFALSSAQVVIAVLLAFGSVVSASLDRRARALVIVAIWTGALGAAVFIDDRSWAATFVIGGVGAIASLMIVLAATAPSRAAEIVQFLRRAWTDRHR